MREQMLQNEGTYMQQVMASGTTDVNYIHQIKKETWSQGKVW